MNITVGATLTGGSSVALSPAGVSPGKSVFVTPDHTVLTPQTIEFTSTPAVVKSGDPGTTRTGVKLTLASRVGDEGCCTVQAGAVIIDLGVRWNLNQPTSEVDSAIGLIRGLVYSTAFVDAIKKAILPSS